MSEEPKASTAPLPDELWALLSSIRAETMRGYVNQTDGTRWEAWLSDILRRAAPPRLPEEEAFLKAAEAKVRLTEPGAPYWNAVVKIKRQLERQANDRLLATYRALVEARKGKA